MKCGKREISSDTSAETFGEVGLGPGEFDNPRPIAVAPDGTVFVADKTGRIQRFNENGEFELSWSMPEFQAGKPTGLGIGLEGHLLVADTHYHRVIIFDRDGQELLRFGSLGRGDGQFIYPTDVAQDADGFCYVGEYGDNDRISKFSADGRFVMSFGGQDGGEVALLRPQGLAFDGDGTLWVADSGHHRICAFDRGGRLLRAFGQRGRGTGELFYPYGITVADDGTLWVCERYAHRVQRFDRQGRWLGSWGSPGRHAGQLAHPWDVAIGPQGWLYVVDSGNHRVHVVGK